jgi:hypothetical protein
VIDYATLLGCANNPHLINIIDPLYGDQDQVEIWVHAGRPFKKLIPIVALHRKRLAGFLKRFWEYYDQLLAYRQRPTSEEGLRLEIEFDHLFSTHTGYDELDQRITKTRAKKASLLLVLKYPELPLHNNAAELGIR